MQNQILIYFKSLYIHLSIFMAYTYISWLFGLFSKIKFLLCDDLSCEVDLIWEIENVKANIVSQISIINLLIRIQAQLDDMLNFSSCDARDSSHNFFGFMLDVATIVTNGSVPEGSSYIFHSVRTVVGRKGSWFPNWINVSHVSERASWNTVEWSCELIDFFISIHIYQSKEKEELVWGKIWS